MAEVRGHQDEEVLKIPSTLCWCQWRPGLPCPNEYTHVIENVVNPGYMKCCEQHKNGFMDLGPMGVKLYTKEEWIAADREQQLNEIILKEKNS